MTKLALTLGSALVAATIGLHPVGAQAQSRGTAAALFFGAAMGALAAGAAAQAQPRPRVQQRAKARPKARVAKNRNGSAKASRDPFAAQSNSIPARYQ